MGLPERQKRFAKHYADRLVGYLDHAGHNSVHASRLIMDDKLIAAVEAEQEQILKAANLTKDDIVNLLLKEAQDKDVQDGARIRAAGLADKSLGAFVEVAATKAINDMNERETIQTPGQSSASIHRAATDPTSPSSQQY